MTVQRGLSEGKQPTTMITVQCKRGLIVALVGIALTTSWMQADATVPTRLNGHYFRRGSDCGGGRLRHDGLCRDLPQRLLCLPQHSARKARRQLSWNRKSAPHGRPELSHSDGVNQQLRTVLWSGDLHRRDWRGCPHDRHAQYCRRGLRPPDGNGIVRTARRLRYQNSNKHGWLRRTEWDGH